MKRQSKPHLLLISAVLPFPLKSGQRRRVRNKIDALRRHFHITLLTVVMSHEVAATEEALRAIVDEAIVLPRLTHRNRRARLRHAVAGLLFTTRHSVRRTNYIMGEVELTPARVAAHIDPADYAVVVYEYWHAYQTTPLFRAHGVPTALDLHDFIWRTYSRRLREFSPPWQKLGWRRKVAAYRRREEAAWEAFDVLIAINQAEADYLAQTLPHKTVIYTPMGIDLTQWAYRPQPATHPPRLGYYGAMAHIGNQEAALWCVEEVLPRVWAERPEVEFWIIGSNPPAHLRALAEQDPRIHVTGFVADPAGAIGQTTAVLCPWRGRFGFRSRVIELLAVGAPVIANADAVYGMGLAPEAGWLPAETAAEYAARCVALLADPALWAAQSRAGRAQVEAQFSFAATYGRLAERLAGLARAPLATETTPPA